MWVDDPASLHKLCPTLSLEHVAQQLEGVLVRHWSPPFDAVAEDDVVIEAFACDLPEEVLCAMAARPSPPVWINLEYLSAEEWIEACHRMPSPHPRLPLLRHFFFPGFTTGSGGLLREPDLFTRREAFRAGSIRAQSLRPWGLADLPPDALVISLFAYEQPALGELLQTWAAAAHPVVLLVPEGRVVPDVARHFGMDTLSVGTPSSDRALSVHVLPFSDQDGYDRLLWACDLNFVRGEDSFVRAQWAAAPFVWHIYPQQEDAHHLKLDAFLLRFLATADAELATAVTTFWRAWNGIGNVAAAWPSFAGQLRRFRQHCAQWSETLAAQEDLASALLNFSETGV